jgi:hypothetical protein
MNHNVQSRDITRHVGLSLSSIRHGGWPCESSGEVVSTTRRDAR